MIAAYIQVALERIACCGDTPSQVFLNAQRGQDYEALLRITERMGDFNDKQQAERFRKEYLEPALAGQLTPEALRLLNISLPVGDIRCLCIAEGPDAMNAIGQWIGKIDQQAEATDAATGLPSDWCQPVQAPPQAAGIPCGPAMPFGTSMPYGTARAQPFSSQPAGTPYTPFGTARQVPPQSPGAPCGYAQPFSPARNQSFPPRYSGIPYTGAPASAANDIPVLDFWDLDDLDPEGMTDDERRGVLQALEVLRSETEDEEPDFWDEDTEHEEWEERLAAIDDKISEFEDF